MTMSTTETATETATTTTVTTTAFSVSIEATTALGVPASVVWSLLADTDAYPEWNPFVRSLRGELEVGERIEVELLLPGRKPQHIRPRIVAVEPGRSFAWLGRIGLPWVFDGRHEFEVRPDGDQACVLVQRERLAGVLVPLFRSMLTGATPAAFASLNEALRVRAEGAH